MTLNPHDCTTLRGLAKRVADIAALPVQSERRQAWRLHNDLKTKRPMILVFPEGSWEELLPASVLRCEDEAARKIEWQLRSRVYTHDHLQDDAVIEKTWTVNKVIHRTGWGLEPQRIPSPERRGAWLFDPVIHEPSDMKRLELGAIFSWKPHPAHLVGAFDDDLIRNHIRQAVEATQANDCVMEMVLKDTHTCEHHPERFGR